MKKLFFLLVAGLLLGIVAFYMNQEREPQIKVVVAERSEMDDLTIVNHQDGAIKWSLLAKKAVYLTDKDVQLRDLTITFPEKEFSMKSEEGFYNTESRNFRIDTPVTATAKSYDIQAKSMFWDGSKNQLVAHDRVYIVGRGFTIEGDNLVATADKATLQKNVRAVFHGK
jgi:hypothetical protein